MSEEEKSGYFNLSDALNEVRHESFGAKDTAVAGLKLLGKGLFNAARFTVTEVIPAAVEQTAKHNARTSKEMLRRDGLSEEQRARLEDVRDKSVQYLDAKEEKRREREALAAEEAREKEFAEYVQGQSPHAETHTALETPGHASEPIAKPEEGNRQQDGAAKRERAAAGQDEAPAAVAPATTAASSGLPIPPAARLAGQAPRLIDYLQGIDKATDRIYVGDRIPADKLEKAYKARHASCRNGKALLLIDDTVLGSGKDGLLVTEEHISFKAAFSDSHDYHLKFCTRLTIPEGFKFHLVPADRIDPVYQQIRGFFSDLLKWHEAAAEKGARDSQFFLSLQYPESDHRAPYWLIRAAQAGHLSAQYNLGMTLKGFDDGLAMHWFEHAAGQGHQLASQRLADMRRAEGNQALTEIPKGAVRLTDMMSPQTLRELDQRIKDSRQALRQAMKQIAEESR